MRRALRCGEGALMVECDTADDALALWRRLRVDPPDGVSEAVPGARTVLVLGRVDVTLRELLVRLPGLPRSHDAVAPKVVVPVRYDGADLNEVAAATGLTRDEVIERHTASQHVVAFGGFVPGFAYLTGLDPRLRIPRHATPRPRVAAGSVAIAEQYSGIYPVDSPGGWRILGSTEITLFDASRQPAALLVPGAAVRFERMR